MLRPDGNLTHELDPQDKGPQDSCGVFGIWAPDQDVSRLTYFGLYALQHRGQQSAGIATSDGQSMLVYKDMGLVSQVFDDRALMSLQGQQAVGHVRYATTGASIWHNAQPTLGPGPEGTIALAHNGNLTNTKELSELLFSKPNLGGEFWKGATTDTSVITALLGMAEHLTDEELETLRFATKPATDPTEPVVEMCHATSAGTNPAGKEEPINASLTQHALRVLPVLRGAFSLVFMDENNLYAARDTQGLRPLVLGRTQGGWAVASETAALDIIAADFVREVEPGELIVINREGVTSYQWGQARPAGCVFEYVYLARPDTKIRGRSVIASRQEMGAALAKEHPVEADLVMPTPESGTPAAIGYAAESGIPFGHGVVKNSYVGRTFIQPTQTIRQLGIRLKLNPLREVVAGKRLIVIDDSIVRGNTQKALVKMLREAGAKEVHVRISSPPVLWPCFFGIDFATRDELIAAKYNTEQICEFIGADSLGYLSVEGMIAATGQAENSLCTACFTGNYPVPPPTNRPL
ncbi:amidophosphoribosyltransferase [Boudabousia liubingyangii]|uniref:Amidophosphoribosyltransferase n=1 Tax=Boudabousia liubingyangii TaxID=1921764 RepID=A0A1Q5PK20_9ACTO|nr:amidophosphoribosyltransferase [Boudabousia liubingyangii]OKL46574.1 amidophosphoribosyltransferase [Boudabousia liubingyangii]OKL46842.1 amidophosphoribosyltransferase [Boudabousia liubingyangii]